MIHIAVCDDDQNFVSRLQEQLEKYAEESGQEIKVTAYYDGLELIENYDPTIGLIFLDIQMKLVDGLSAAKRIRQMDERVGILFLTTLTQYGLEGYRYQAVNYIIKPMKYERLKAELDKFLEQRRRDDSLSLVIANDTGKYKVFLNSLRYVETFNRNLLYHTEQENLICRKSMKKAELELLAQGFARCHTSYIVNLFYVKGVRKLEVALITGETLPVSRPRRREFMERLTEFWGNKL